MPVRNRIGRNFSNKRRVADWLWFDPKRQKQMEDQDNKQGGRFGLRGTDDDPESHCLQTIQMIDHGIHPPGSTHVPAPGHMHPHAEEVFIIIRGTGAFQLGDEQYRIKAGDVIYVPPGTPHLMICGPKDEEIENYCICVPVPEPK